ncbi:MAG: hypothetical protein FWG73_07535 [Planctomycetaceae bacterium]|nr:hypothetical protein [Planctomycetaceae bacterium]
MAEPRIIITLDGRGSRQYRPSETLAGSYRLDSMSGDDVRSVECSILWYTTGKGSDDFGVYAFWRYSIADGDWIDPRTPGRFSTILPKAPLSYTGMIVKIHWTIRVRVFLADGREIVEDFSFRLGSLPDVRVVKPA